jgi:hypothetical protein
MNFGLICPIQTRRQGDALVIERVPFLWSPGFQPLAGIQHEPGKNRLRTKPTGRCKLIFHLGRLGIHTSNHNAISSGPFGRLPWWAIKHCPAPFANAINGACFSQAISHLLRDPPRNPGFARQIFCCE